VKNNKKSKDQMTNIEEGKVNGIDKLIEDRIITKKQGKHLSALHKVELWVRRDEDFPIELKRADMVVIFCPRERNNDEEKEEEREEIGWWEELTPDSFHKRTWNNSGLDRSSGATQKEWSWNGTRHTKTGSL
jgi:hypothetical protein